MSIGLDDWDFRWSLEPGQSFATPSSIAGYTEQGFGGTSRHLHDFIRETVVPHGSALHQVLFNSWETTFFNVNESSQTQFAEIAAEMGIELFVMDDGWFHGRKDDYAGLGDWWPDAKKFPNGLGPLIERVNQLGMDFGIWIEPEMVNPDSELYRQLCRLLSPSSMICRLVMATPFRAKLRKDLHRMRLVAMTVVE